MRTRVLITNDDGIGAPGLHWLARVATDRGLDVVVAAPKSESSGSSAAMNAVEHGGKVIVTEWPLDGVPDAASFAVDASPAFITLLGMHGAFGDPPQVVLSGVNRGANAGRAMLHSGTAGAAFTAAANGAHGMAVSLDVLSAITASAASGGAAVREVTAEDRQKDHRRNWVTAATLALDLLPDLMAGPVETILNVNSPDVARHRLRGVRRSELACFGQVQMTVAEAGTGFVRTALEEPGEVAQPGTDLAHLAQGYATVTTLRALTETDDDLEGLRGWQERSEGAS